MPRYIIKPKRDEDFYVAYSTVVDSPCESGTRSDFLSDGTDPARLDRADDNGSSAMWHEGYWDDDRITVREGVEDATRNGAWWGTIARDDLRAFCETLQDDGYFHPPAGMVAWDRETNVEIRRQP